MIRTLGHLTERERLFIDLVYVQKRKFDVVAEILKENRSEVTKLNKNLDSEWRPISQLVLKWNNKKIGGNFWDFYHWHKVSQKRCHYCGISGEEIDKLISLGLTNKRAKTRGKTFELDRKRPNESYNKIDNLVYACYWCNNAKTDTFSEDEFLIIGKAIATVWKKRLGK